MQATRTLKVYQSLQNSFPRINLQGKWLQQLGFEIGDCIAVSAKYNQLIITNAPSKSCSKKSKKLKVYQALGSCYPRINLQGKWVQQLGFDIGNHIEVALSDNQLIITKIDEAIESSNGEYQNTLGNMTPALVREVGPKPRGRRPINYYLNKKGGM